MRKILIICGPTAIGKTGLGIKLAKEFNGEIISADSRQVYKYMDIATGKNLPKFSIFNSPAFAKSDFATAGKQLSEDGREVGYYSFDGIPVWMLDVVEPDKIFTVADYYELAWKVIENIWERGKLPIVVGGTGFYIKALSEGVGTLGVEPDWLLRKELQALTISELQEFLEKIDRKKLKAMNDSDKKNSRRLLRAIEIGLQQKRDGKQPIPKTPKMDILSLGLKAPLAKIYERIDKRIEMQLQAGAKREVENLIKKGYSWDLPSMTAMGYREWKNFWEGKSTEEEIIQKWKYSEHGYARRQMTWFRKMPRIFWFDITKKGWSENVEKVVQAWYS